MIEIVISELHSEDILTGFLIEEKNINEVLRVIEDTIKSKFNGISFIDALEVNI